MRLLLLLLSLFALFHDGVNAQTKVYTGKIDGKYEVEMHLRVVNDEIYGYYLYKGKNVPIPLHSDQYEHAIRLYEGDLTDNVFFEGIIDEKTFAGTWKDTNKNKFYPFALTETNTENTDKDREKNSGYYENNDMKELVIEFINNSYAYFDITVGSESCLGHVNGIAKIKKPNVVTFSDASCKLLSFTMNGKTIIVKEEACNDYHGAACYFGGNYFRAKK